MRRAYKFRAYPARPQEGRAARLLADHCDLYNAALEERRKAWRMRQATITYGTQSAQRVIWVNPAGTSIGCHRCGRRCTRPRQDTVTCPAHGPMDADVNGARNVFARAGLGSGRAVPAA